VKGGFQNAMNKLKWYQKLLIALTVIIFSPLIVAGIIIAGIYTLFKMPKNKKEYKNSRYYADFQHKFMTSILYSPEYRFYNSAMHRGLPIKYVKQESNGFEYFIHNETIYLFPDFDQIDLNEEGNVWQADYDGDWKPFDECYANLLAKLESTPIYPIKLLVERKMFPTLNLNGKDIPDCIFVTWNYENAFENEESPLKMIIPQNSKELYDMMLQTPDLCGTFELNEGNENIEWLLHENIKIELGVDPRDCYFGVSRLLFGNVESSITHWHPTIFEIYDDVCNVGKRGNVMVLRSTASSGTLMYSGSKADCPYAPDKKYLFGKYYYLEAK
jgi:hypothetical protein